MMLHHKSSLFSTLPSPRKYGNGTSTVLCSGWFVIQLPDLGNGDLGCEEGGRRWKRVERRSESGVILFARLSADTRCFIFLSTTRWTKRCFS